MTTSRFFPRAFSVGIVAAGIFFSPAAVLAMPSPLKVVGPQLLNGAGQLVRLRGVNCAGLEWSSDADGHILKSVQVAVTEWRANLIRLPLSQDRWFGKGPEQKDTGAGYRALVKQLVDFCADHDAYLLLDLHWSNAGEWGENIGQHSLPDKNSVTFWKDVAQNYRDHPAVLFDLYNEPNRVTWEQWLNGGEIVERDDKHKESVTYKAVGLRALLEAVRSAGARNVVVASGINWAYELKGIPSGHALADPHGNGVVYAIHVYPHEFENIGRETIPQVAARIEAFAQKFPVLVGEFGSNTNDWPFPKGSDYTDEKWNREFLNVIEEHGWNWTAWDFHPTAAPCLIADWTYAPTPQFGAWVKEALAKNLPATGR